MLLSRVTYKESHARDSLMCFHSEQFEGRGGLNLQEPPIGRPAASVLDLIMPNYFSAQLGVLGERGEKDDVSRSFAFTVETHSRGKNSSKDELEEEKGAKRSSWIQLGSPSRWPNVRKICSHPTPPPAGQTVVRTGPGWLRWMCEAREEAPWSPPHHCLQPDSCL